MKPLVIANWKMNPTSQRTARSLFERSRRYLAGVRGVEVVIAPPFPYLGLVEGRKTFRLAAQNVFWEMSGPYTGEVSPAMLQDLGVYYVLVGHSERRRILGEHGEAISRKVHAVIRAGMVPVLAIGEDARESEEVVPKTLFVQLSEALSGVPKRVLQGVVIAYEPIWAISTMPGAKSATPDHATRRAIYIRKLLVRSLGSRIADTIRIIYGGSVSAKNAADYIARDIRGMEGLLIGGASLRPGEFGAIVKAVVEKRRRG